MPSRLSLIFDFTTDPEDRTAASAHSGGWSEGFWFNFALTATDARIFVIANRRSILLSRECSIIGARIENFTIAGNKLLPGGTSSQRFLVPGGLVTMDAPQIGVQLSGKSATTPNTNRFVLRGIPDDFVENGEYQPSAAGKAAMTLYTNQLINANAGFIGRDKTQPSARVNSINNGVVTLSAPVGGVAEQDYLIFNRVVSASNVPVKGAYLITNIAGNVYTLQNLSSAYNLVLPSGSARLDRIAYFSYGSISPQRLVSKKVGRPFEGYRGRRSKLRA